MYKVYRKPRQPDVWYVKPHSSWFYHLVKWALAAPFLAVIAGYVLYGLFFF